MRLMMAAFRQSSLKISTEQIIWILQKQRREIMEGNSSTEQITIQGAIYLHRA